MSAGAAGKSARATRPPDTPRRTVVCPTTARECLLKRAGANIAKPVLFVAALLRVVIFLFLNPK
jgi:hypothetical protein